MGERIRVQFNRSGTRLPSDRSLIGLWRGYLCACDATSIKDFAARYRDD